MTSPFDEKAEWFDRHYGSTRGRTRLALLLERLGEALPPPPARILDAGGGSGAVAIPLAERGYHVTLLDPSGGMLDVARSRASAAGVELEIVQGAIEGPAPVASAPFDVVCCHAVLLYTDDPRACLRELRSRTRERGILSLLEKNRDALAMRPGLRGDFAEAIRVLDDPVAAGNLGIANRSRSITEWRAMLDDTGWRLDSWVGIRLFSDGAPDDLPPERLAELVDLERAAGRREPYRSASRLLHVLARAM